jgi:exonuclease SbcC
VRIERIELRRTPGIAERFALEGLAPGLNVIVGRNGSGKSSLCRFVRGTLWPQTLPHSAAGEVTFEEDGKPWVAVREHRDVHWSRNGVEADAPPLPEARFARCFTLGMRDLIGGDATDRLVVEEFRRAMAGGYDVRAVAEACFAKRPAAAKYAVTVDDASRTLAELLARQRALADQERRLPELDVAFAAAEDAARRLPLVRIALERERAQVELSERERLRSALRAGLDRMRGDELRTLAELDRDAEAARREREECERRIADSKGVLATGQVKDIDVVGQAAAERDLREATELEAQLKAARHEREKARAYYRSAWITLGKDVPEDTALRVDAAALDAAERMVEAADALRLRRLGLEARLREVMHPERKPEPARWKKGVDILSYWLAEMPDPARTRWRRVALVAAVTCLLGAGVLITELPLAGGAALGVSLGLLAFFAFAGALRDGAAERDRWRVEYTRLRLRQPAEWSEDAVVDLRGELEEEWSAQLHDFQMRSVLAAEDLRLKSDEEAHAARRARVADGLQLVAGDGSDLSLSVLAHRVRELQARAGERARAEATVVHLESELASILARVRAVLAKNGETSAETTSACAAALAHLKDRARALNEATAVLAREQPRLNTLNDRTAENARRRERLFREAGLAVDDVATLKAMADEFPRWKVLAEECRQLRSRFDERTERLAGHDDLATLPRAELELEAERLERIAATRTNLVQERARIQAEVEQATAADAVARALERRAFAKENLEDARSTTLDHEAGAFLMDQVARDFVRESRPPVVKKAQQWFARFTANAYRLEVGDDVDELRAIDSASERVMSLEELSDGTRIQLLLAARLAYATQAERGTKLPLFLDEVLTTADGDRFRAIAQALLVMAREERRQVFYLSANPLDVAAWRAFAAEHGDDAVRAFDLDDVRGRARAAELELVAEPARHVPAPVGASPEDYARRIGAAPFSPWRAASAQHVFWLARHDLEALYALLSARVTTVGQWRQLRAGGGATAVVGATRAAELDAYVDVLDRFVQAFSEGRGKAVDTDVLLAAGVSDQFVERLSSLARDLGGDPRKLIETIDARTDERTRHFRMRDKLVAWMKEHGVLDDRAALDEVGIRGRVLAGLEERLRGGAVVVDAVVRRVRELWSASRAEDTTAQEA